MESKLNKTSADQTKPKVIRRSGCRASLYRKIASKNMILGPIYWKKPRVEYWILLAAAVKHSSGTVVTRPAAAIIRFISRLRIVKSLALVAKNNQ